MSRGPDLLPFSRHWLSLHSFSTILQIEVKSKSEAIPVTGCGGLYGYEMLRIPHLLDNRHKDGGKVVSPTHRPRSTPQEHYFSASGTHFC
jgi:hypothetical protein